MKRGNSKTYPSTDAFVLCDGGLNSKFDRAIIGDSETPSALNVVFTNGAVETRPGASMVNTTPIGSFLCDGFYTRHDSTGAETMVGFWGGTMYALGGTTFTAIASSVSAFTAGVRVGTAEYENKMFIGNGGVDPYKWDGTYFTRHGVPAPGSAPSAGCAVTGGSLSGSFTFKVTYVNSFAVEGDLGPAVTFTAAGGCINLSGIPVAPQSFGVSARRIYLATGTTYLLKTEIADNSTTTYTVETSAVSSSAPSDNGVPPKYSQVIYHKDRLFMNDPSNPNYYWYSELGEPYTVPSTNFGTVGDATKDNLVGFQVQGDNLLLICERSETLLYMPTTDPNDWSTVRVASAYGSKSPFAFVPYTSKVMFPALDGEKKIVGFASIAGQALAPSATFLTTSAAGSDLQSNPIEPDIFQIPESYLNLISGISYKNRLFFALPYGSSTYNNRVYVYDYSASNLGSKKEGSWIPFTGWNASQFTVYGGNLYYASSTASGIVYRCMIDGVYNDAGAAINSYFWSKEFSGFPGDQNYHKDFRYLDLYFEKSGNYYIDVGYRNDGDLGGANIQQLSVNPGGSLWGSMRFGIDLWGGGQNDGFEQISLGQARGKRIQFYFSNKNVADRKFKVTGYSFTYNKKGVR